MSLVPISTPLPGPSVTTNRTVRCGQLCAIVGSAEARKATTATRVARSVGSERFAADMRLLRLSTYKVTRASPIASCNHTEAKWAAQSTVLVTRRERRRRHAAEQRDELAPFQLIELFRSLPARAALQDIEWARSVSKASPRLR